MRAACVVAHTKAANTTPAAVGVPFAGSIHRMWEYPVSLAGDHTPLAGSALTPPPLTRAAFAQANGVSLALPLALVDQAGEAALAQAKAREPLPPSATEAAGG